MSPFLGARTSPALSVSNRVGPRGSVRGFAVVTAVSVLLLASLAFQLGSDRPTSIAAPTGPTHLAQSPAVAPARSTERGAPVGALGPRPALSFSVVWTPANHTGPIPLKVSWSVTVSGAVGPYYVNVSVPNGTVYHGGNGSTVFTYAAWFQVNVNVEGCSAGGCGGQGTGIEFIAWGSGGPNPVKSHLSALNGTVPFTVNASLTITGGPTNPTVLWFGPSNQSWGGLTTQFIFYWPGSQAPGFCVYYSGALNYTQAPFSCGHTDTINVNGTSYFLSVSGTPTSGVSPVTTTVWANLSHTNLIPVGSRLSMEVQAPTNQPNVTFLTNPPPPSNQSCGCSYWTTSANNTSARVVLVAPYSVVAYGFIDFFLQTGASQGYSELGSGSVTVTISPANNSPPPPYPVLSFSVTPGSGAAPLNVSINATAQGGQGPYSASFGEEVVTPGAGSGNSSFHVTTVYWKNVTGWNGSVIPFTHTFAQPGNFTIFGLLNDSAGQVTWGAAVVSVTPPNASPPPPPFAASGSVIPPTNSAPQSVGFRALVSGGLPPYTVQWRFGDGTSGSSVPGAVVFHTYLQPGVYTPQLTIRDGLGHVVTQTLPSIRIVLPPSQALTTPGAKAGWDSTVSALVVVTAAIAVCTAALYVVRRRVLRNEGRALVEPEYRDWSFGEEPPSDP